MTPSQKVSFQRLLDELHVTELHHGDCVGADAEAHDLAREVGIKIVVHPPVGKERRAFKVGDEIRGELANLDRNREIVKAVGGALIACPSGFTEFLRSGTWATVRYASKYCSAIWIILPDGRVEVREREP
jgi:hypothetical protein